MQKLKQRDAAKENEESEQLWAKAESPFAWVKWAMVSGVNYKPAQASHAPQLITVR